MKRFAIYYAPAEDSPLTRAASAWLGRDAFTGVRIPYSSRNGFTHEEWDAMTADARGYGFHATLKPPFRMAQTAREEDLRERLHAFAASRRPFEVTLQLGALGRFLALVLTHPSSEFMHLAADCVRGFDEFRAPASEAELARRRQAQLNQAQQMYLTKWGYPYVMEEWRFHMTLTSSLHPDRLGAVRVHLTNEFEPLCREPLLVDSICLFEQESHGAPFLVRERYPFV